MLTCFADVPCASSTLPNPGTSPADPARKEVNHAFDRALVFMHKMPRIWIDYLKFLSKQRMITVCRQKFDAALLSLPITQHHRVWPLYLTFIKSHDIPETSVRVYRRHLKLDPDAAEDYIEYVAAPRRRAPCWGRGLFFFNAYLFLKMLTCAQYLMLVV